MERARQFTYILQHPHSRVTREDKVNTWTRTGEEKVNTWTQTEEEKVNIWTQRGQQQFYNKLQKSGLKLETLGSDTMLSFMHQPTQPKVRTDGKG
jgi:hypothetical protein